MPVFFESDVICFSFAMKIFALASDCDIDPLQCFWIRGVVDAPRFITPAAA
jgi:hypothetical protein